jgi:peptide/nickel transport system permease protein
MAAPTTPKLDSDPGSTPVAATTVSPVVETTETYLAISRAALVRKHFLRNKLAVVGVATLVLLYVLAFVGPYVIPFDYKEIDYTALLTPPDSRHWFGTTQIGQDVLAQTLRGLQKSLTIGLLVALGSTTIAAVVGSAAGYFGGWTDRSLMWVVDMLLVLPSFLIIAIASPALQGKSWLFLVVLLVAFQWMIAARIVRGLTLSLREREFVQAAKFMGTPARKIIASHILPNMSSLLIIDATITVGTAIIAETGLSFFGFGVQPPDVSLGTLIADGTASALTFPWLFAFSLGFLVLTVLSANFAGDGLRDALDPNSQKGRAT